MKRFSIINFLLFFCFFTCNAQIESQERISIRSLELKQDRPTDISGEWQFFYGKHLTAGEMKSLKPGEKHFVKLPSNWKKTPINGKNLPAFGIATYYRQLILPSDQKKGQNAYGFWVGNITSAYKLWVNDVLVMQAGRATPDKNGFEPTYLPQTGAFSSDSDTLDVVIQVSNFFDINYAGASQKIYFGEKEAIDNFAFNKNSLAIFILSIFFLLFFFQISIRLVHREDPSHLMLALLSVLFLMKMTLDGDVLLFHFIPGIDFMLGYRLWLCSFLSIPVVFRLTRIAFPLDMNPVVEKVVDVFFLTCAFIFMTLNIQFVMSIIFYVIYASFACVGYLFFILAKAIRNRRKYSLIHMISFTIMILLLFNDLIFVTDQEAVGYLSQFGVCLYIITQSVIASLKFARSQKQALWLSMELEKTNRNLEKVVRERTEELQESNTKLAKLNKQKDFLISTITHDLKNSFNTLINYSYILKEKTIDVEPEDRENIINLLYDTSVKSHGILENILSWAKLMITSNSGISIIDHLSGVVENNARFASEQLKNKFLSLNTDINDQLLFRCNEGHLETILRNLLSNAIKFSSNGSTISIFNKLENETVSITVHDEGIGIPENMVSTIFDSSKEKKRQGTAGEPGSGLGLLIVKELVESNQGTISCSSIPEQGTDFTIYFPLYRE